MIVVMLINILAAQVLLILQLSHDALVSDEILTKRHIYYQHQELFGSQARLDELVDCVALTLRARREDLNVVCSRSFSFTLACLVYSQL